MTIPACYKNENSDINPTDIWADDLFNRQYTAQFFTKIITSVCQSYVISINSKYGSGKTFFLNRWAEELKQSGEIVITFDSWDYDFVEKPLLPFLYNFLEQLKKQGLVEYDFDTDFQNCKDVIVKCFKNFINVASKGCVNIDDLKKYTNADNIQIPKIQTLEEYNELRNALQGFKESLKQIVRKNDNKNIYVFVDELERCRPTFAIELLEAIKHLFNVKGLVFVLGTDRSQLKHTISNIYGINMDSEGYLRRFIDLELELPAVKTDIFVEYLKNKFEIQNKNINNKDNWVLGFEYFHKYFNIFSQKYNFQLREIEQIYAKFNVITKMLDENVIKITPLLALLMILKIKNENLYNEFSLENLSFDNIENYLKTNVFPKAPNPTIEYDRLLANFNIICLALLPIDYNSKYIQATTDRERIFFERLYKMQDSAQALHDDKIQFVKDLISHLYIN